MRKYIFLVCSLVLFGTTYAQKDVTVPETTSFDSAMGSSSSVNQSNGKLNINLELVSLKSYKDLNASFGINYDGAMVVKDAAATNEFAPQGVLGLGWGMTFTRILADNKLTATRDDDTYYLMEGGLNELIAVAKSPTRYDFKTKMHKPWKVYYYPLEEKWEIVKDNGYTYTFADVDWTIHWGNWIGDSNRSAASRQGSSWNLTKIEDLHGNSVQYEYQHLDRSLKNTGAVKHTEATYLSKIIGPHGEEVRFTYSNKPGAEYFQPNSDQSEPDAYQEIIERKYLVDIKVYNSNVQLMYTYDFNYSSIGSGSFTKRLLKEIIWSNTSGDQQTFREFEYDENSSSDFYGALTHQILPTKGRISYQYATNEIPIDQVYETTILSENSTLIIQKNYILKLDWLNDLYLLTWDGTTWNQQLVSDDIPSGGVNGDYKSMPIVAKENFFLLLHGGSPDKVILGGLKDNGKTWNISSTTFDDLGATLLGVKMMSGNDFVAIGNPDHDRIHFYRWDRNSWDIKLIQTSSTGNYYYAGTNNYVIKNKRQSGQDAVTFYYYDLLGDIQSKSFNVGFSTTGSIGADNYWYAQNSFAQVNANANPEYMIRWDENYDYVDKDAPFGWLPDHIRTYGFYNNYFSVSEDIDHWTSYSTTNTGRYLGDGQWITKGVLSAPFNDENTLVGFGRDVFTHPSNATTGNTNIHVFNANTAAWETSSYAANGGGIDNDQKMSFEAFGRRYIFANRRLYRIHQNLGITPLSNYNSNTILAKSDGGNVLYISSRNGNQTEGTPFAKILSITDKNQVFTHDIESGYYLWQNKYKNYQNFGIGHNTFIVKDENSNTAKIYRVIDGKIDFDGNDPVYKDYVIVKETYDPVLTRKHRKYYCYTDPILSQDNRRVYYENVAQLNDVDGILGKTVTSYDTGETDFRRIGLPLKIRHYDGDNNLVSEQINTWAVTDLDWESQLGPGVTYYLQMSSKLNRSFEGNDELFVEEDYQYDFVTGYLKKKEFTDSEGNVETTEHTYLFEEFPSVEADNLLSPVIYTKAYSRKGTDPIVYKNAIASVWDLSGVPTPKDSYQWDGTGGATGIQFDFQGGSNNDFRNTQIIELTDSNGNVLQAKNRTDVTTAYIYGYSGKQLVAKIEGGTYSEAMALVNTSILNNPASDSQLQNELQLIRDGLSNAFVTSYTHHPSIGMTSETDPRGRTTTYVYDDFYRLDHVKDNEGYIVKKNEYQYRSAPFNYTTESTDIPDCSVIGIGINNNGDPDPVTLSLVKLFDTGNTVTFEVTASDGGSYAFLWNHTQTGGSASDFNIETLFGGTQLKITSLQCVGADFSVQAYINVTGGTNIHSNTVN
ncbi:MAG: hypothetical protein AAF489_08640, partial [Bacteroidota bacterium]